MRPLLFLTIAATLWATAPRAQSAGTAPTGTAVPPGTSTPSGTAGQPGTSGQPSTVGGAANPSPAGAGTPIGTTTGGTGEARPSGVLGGTSAAAGTASSVGYAQPVVVSGKEPVSLSLEQATAYALRHNAAIKNARLDVQLQKQKNREITGVALPQLNAREEFTAYPKPIVSFFPARFLNPAAGEDEFAPVTIAPTYASTASISGSQILFDGQVLVALQARNTIIELTELGVEASAQDVRYNVRRAYYGLVIAQQQFRILQQSLATFRDALADLQALRAQGFVEKIEVDRTQVQVNNLATDSLRTANLILLSEQLLKYNMTLPGDQPIVLTDTSIGEMMTTTASMLDGIADYNKRVDYTLLQTQLRLNEFDVKRYRNKALPTLAAFGNYSFTYGNNRLREVLTPDNYIAYSLVGLRLDVPIFTGFTRKAQLEQAILNVEKTRNNLQQLRLSIDFQSESSRTALRNALLALQSNERNIELANTVLDLARKKYKAGVGSNIEVTQAQTELLQAQNRLFAAQLDVINATTDLQRAQGLFR